MHHSFNALLTHDSETQAWCITRSDEWCITMLWAVMHHSTSCDALRFTMPWAVMPSLVLIWTSCDALPSCGTVMHHLFWTSCDALLCHGTVMHHSFWTSCDALRFTMPWAVGRDAITRFDERAVMHYHAVGCDAITRFDERAVTDALMPYHAVVRCISQSRSSKMTQRSFGHASFWTIVIGRSMAHYQIEQKYLIITNYTYIFWVTTFEVHWLESPSLSSTLSFNS